MAQGLHILLAILQFIMSGQAQKSQPETRVEPLFILSFGRGHMGLHACLGGSWALPESPLLRSRPCEVK